MDTTLESIAKEAVARWKHIWETREADRVYVEEAVRASITNEVAVRTMQLLEEYVREQAKEQADEIVSKWLSAGFVVPRPDDKQVEWLEDIFFSIGPEVGVSAATSNLGQVHRMVSAGGTERDVAEILAISRSAARALMKKAAAKAQEVKATHQLFYPNR